MRRAILGAPLLTPLVGWPAGDTPGSARLNILIAIADDLSHVHTSFAGFPAVKTPALDRVAREGVDFRNAFAPTPGCSPTRAAFLVARADDPEIGRYLRLERFSIERDREYVLPVIKTAQRLNPQLRFFASPWTPPPRMKSNGK